MLERQGAGEALRRGADVGGRGNRHDAAAASAVSAPSGWEAASTEEPPSEMPSEPTLVAPIAFSCRATASRSSPSFQPPLEGASLTRPVRPKLRRSTAATLKPHS